MDGLSKLQQVAAMAMQGLLAGGYGVGERAAGSPQISNENVITRAFALAKLLIEHEEDEEPFDPKSMRD